MKTLRRVGQFVVLFLLLFSGVVANAQQDKSEENASWKNVETPVNVTLWDVHFGGEKKVFAVGDSGTILVSEDGGKSWKKQESGSKADLRGVHFLDESNGYVVGDGDPNAPQVKRGHVVGGRPRTCGTLLKTSNAGQDWNNDWIQTNFYLRDIFMISGERGQICNHGGGHADGDRIITHNGGKKWYQNRVYRGLNECFWVDQNNAWAVGSRVSVGFIPEPKSSLYQNKKDRIVYTTDGGKTWKTQNSSIGGRKQLHSIWMVDKSSGVAVGDGGTVLSTSNGGDKWKKTDSGTEASLYSVCLTGKNSGYAAGKNGTMLKLEEGKEWKTVSTPTDDTLFGVYFSPSGKTAIAVGKNGTVLRWTR